MEAEPPTADPPRRNRRWFQFRLRSLLIFMPICAIGSVWVARRIEQKRKVRESRVNEAVFRLYRVEGFPS
jgi:hypothetical protein